MLLGKRLKELRGRRTQEEISKRLGVSRPSYSHYETGHVEPSLTVLKRMAHVYGVSTDYLLGVDVDQHHYDKIREILTNIKGILQ